MTAVKLGEVRDILRAVANRETSMVPDEGYNWLSGDPYFYFAADGWSICAFNDAMDLDYIEWAKAPDGRRTEFQEWWDEQECDPLELLTPEEQDQLLAVFEGKPAPKDEPPARYTIEVDHEQMLVLRGLPSDATAYDVKRALGID